MPHAFITVHRSQDPIAAEIVRDLLVDDGLDARLLGGTAEGTLNFGAESRIDVRAEHEPRARRIIEAHLGELGPALESDDERASPPSLRALLAAGVVLCPGGAHFYTRRPLTGGAILAGQLAMIVTMAAAGPRAASGAALFACGLLLYDLVAGQLAVRAWNRGARPAPLRQLAHAALLFMGMGAVAIACAPFLERLQLPHRKGGGGSRSPGHEIRARSGDPARLPFPLHLDLRGR